MEWKCSLESESKPEIERNHLHHKDKANQVSYTTNWNWLSHTISMGIKYSILLKYMNLWNDLDLKWPLESESEPEIERKNLQYKDMAN